MHYEPPPITENAAATGLPAVRRSSGVGLGLLVFVLLLGIAAAYGYQQRQQLMRLGQLEAQLQAEQTRAAKAEARSGAAQKSLAEQLDVQARALAALSENRDVNQRLQLYLVEHLLLTANERAQLSHDAVSAQLALELADARLAQLNQPQLFKLREAIAQERAALARVPRADRVAAGLKVASIIQGAERLPLAARAPERFEAPAPESAPTPLPADAGWLQQAWAQIKQALGAMFSVRQARGPAPRLLAPEQEALVYQILLLRLESVRASLLAGEAEALREASGAASTWLLQRFHAEDAGVRAALKDLEDLAALPVSAPLPDITGSLALLRAHLSQLQKLD